MKNRLVLLMALLGSVFSVNAFSQTEEIEQVKKEIRETEARLVEMKAELARLIAAEKTFPLTINLNEDGMVSLVKGKPMTMAELVEKFDWERFRGSNVILRVDDYTPIEKVTKLMDVLRQNGITKIRIQTKR